MKLNKYPSINMHKQKQQSSISITNPSNSNILNTSNLAHSFGVKYDNRLTNKYKGKQNRNNQHIKTKKKKKDVLKFSTQTPNSYESSSSCLSTISDSKNQQQKLHMIKDNNEQKLNYGMQPSLFQFQLQNHNLRKQSQFYHQKTIHQYHKRKHQIVKIMNGEDKKRQKVAYVQNKMQECIKNANSTLNNINNINNVNGGENIKNYLNQKVISAYLQSNSLEYGSSRNTQKLLSSTGNQFRRKTQGAIFKNSHLCQRFQSQFINTNYDSNMEKYFGLNQSCYNRGSPSHVSFQNKNSNLLGAAQFCNSSVYCSGSSIKNREVNIANIVNIDELRKSLAHSRAKFNTKIIRMERQIGRLYVPFQDKLPGGEGCVKGIFL